MVAPKRVAVPSSPTSSRTGPPSATALGLTSWGGGVILLARPGMPRLSSTHGVGPRYVWPVHAPPKTLGSCPSLALTPVDSPSPKSPNPDLPADQGRAVSVGPRQAGGGDADPVSSPPTRWRQLRAGAIERQSCCGPTKGTSHAAGLPRRPPLHPMQSNTPPPPRPVVEPPVWLPNVFGRVSAALSNRAVLRRPLPPWRRGRPQHKATRSIADMLPPPPPAPQRAARGGAPLTPWRTRPKRVRQLSAYCRNSGRTLRKHGRHLKTR